MIRPAAWPERTPSDLDEAARAINVARRNQWLLAAAALFTATIGAIAAVSHLVELAVGSMASTAACLIAYGLMHRSVNACWRAYGLAIAADAHLAAVQRGLVRGAG